MLYGSYYITNIFRPVYNYAGCQMSNCIGHFTSTPPAASPSSGSSITTFLLPSIILLERARQARQAFEGTACRLRLHSIPRRPSPLLLILLYLAVLPGLASAADVQAGLVGTQCDLSGVAKSSEHIQNLRIAAIFIVLASSVAGILIPFIPQLASSLSRSKGDTTSNTSSKERKPSKSKHKTWDETFFILRHFGTGVVVATAFVHLSYESITELESPCIDLVYKPLGAVLQMIALGLVFLVDLVVSRYLSRLRKRNETRKAEAHARYHRDHAETIHHQYQVGNGDPESVSHVQRANGDLLEKDEEYAKAEDARLDERTKELEVMIIEGGIV